MRDLLSFLFLTCFISACIWAFKQADPHAPLEETVEETPLPLVEGLSTIAVETRDTAEEVLRTLESMNERLLVINEMLVEIRVRREAEALADQRLAPLRESLGLCF